MDCQNHVACTFSRFRIFLRNYICEMTNAIIVSLFLQPKLQSLVQGPYQSNKMKDYIGNIHYLNVCVWNVRVKTERESELTLYGLLLLSPSFLLLTKSNIRSSFMANFRGESYQKFYVNLTSPKCVNAATFNGFQVEQLVRWYSKQ